MKTLASGSFVRRVALAVMLSALIGCQRSSTTSQDEQQSGPSPRERLAELADRYRQAETYQDAGELRFLVEGAPENEFRSLPFSVAIERPNKIRIHALDTINVADGELLRSIVESLPGQILSRPCPATISAANFSDDELLAQAMRGQLNVDLPQLALLTSADPLAELADDCTATQLSDSEFQGKKCSRIKLAGPAGTSELWIEQESGLLVKYEFPLEEIRRKFPLARLWAEFRGARIDEPIDSVAFDVELPSDIKLVSRFVMPAPAAPPEPLGKPLDEFTFIAMDGTAIGTESLAGKIVVMDVWATWCGWCFEGLPLLEKVYQQYQDNEQVVFLAVNKDEPTISNAKVEHAFKNHNLTIPIVRDVEQVADRVLRLQGLPTMLVLGTDGTVQDYHIGYNPQLAETLPQTLERLLAGENLAQEKLDAYAAEQEAYRARLAEVLIEPDQASGKPDVAGQPNVTR